MAFWQTRITHASITFSPFTSESMATIGQVALDHIVARIKNVQDYDDAPAKPLNEKYKKQKTEGRYVALGGNRKYRGKDVRDWTLRGRTLQSLKVKTASENRVTIGPTLYETFKIIAGRNKLDHMWGFSPSDKAVIDKVVRETLLKVKAVRIVKQSVAA